MRTLLWLLGVLCLTGAAVELLSWLMGGRNLLPLVPGSVVAGIVLLSWAEILERLIRIEFLLKSSHPKAAERVVTDLGDFEKLGPVEGEAMCVRCRKLAPKAGLYYNKAMDVYYHPECLARDRAD
jgi:hypothetical protein